MLLGVRWWFVDDVSGQPVSPIFKGLTILDPQNEARRMSWNVANQPATQLEVSNRCYY